MNFDPQRLKNVQSFQILIKQIVSEVLGGRHNSSLLGANIEFAQYREYQAGDDIRSLDWKLAARSNRYYIKQSEETKQHHFHFILDASASMNYEEDGIKKLDCANMLIGALAYIAEKQGDTYSLLSLNDVQQVFLAKKNRRNKLSLLLHQLITTKAEGKFPTSIQHQLNSSEEKRTIIFISDLLEHNTEIVSYLKTLRNKNTEFWVLFLQSDKERTLDFEEGLIEFEDLETNQKVKVNPKQAQEAYQANLQAVLDQFKKEIMFPLCSFHRINFVKSMGSLLRQLLNKK